MFITICIISLSYTDRKSIVALAHTLHHFHQYHNLLITGVTEVNIMTWETPAYSDVRFGFEVTMYISNR